MDVKSRKNQPASIRKQGNTSLQIEWDDGHISRYSFRYLRQKCPCAACIDEWSSKNLLNPDTIPLDIEGLTVEPVGGYALSFTFSDHHNTGIYHFSHLRVICPCKICQPK